MAIHSRYPSGPTIKQYFSLKEHLCTFAGAGEDDDCGEDQGGREEGSPIVGSVSIFSFDARFNLIKEHHQSPSSNYQPTVMIMIV